MVEIKGLKIYIVIFVTLLIVGLFFAAQYLLALYRIDKPLRDQLAALEGIKGLEIIENAKSTDIRLELEPGIDFYNLYQNVDGIMEKILGNKRGKIIITNNSIKELSASYLQMHYAIYEGINTGRFLEMKKNIDDIALSLELDNYQVWVDNEAVYLQLDKNNNSFYSRISYHDNNVK